MASRASLRASSQAGDLLFSQITKLLLLGPTNGLFTYGSRTIVSPVPDRAATTELEVFPAEQLPKFRNATKHWIDQEEPQPPVEIAKQHLLTAGVLGVPNAGKSTLTNALVRSKARFIMVTTLLLNPDCFLHEYLPWSPVTFVRFNLA